jgi:hypothetical protein
MISPWDAYYSVLYPEPARPISAFGQWKRATTGVNITKALWEARERARKQWTAGPRTGEEQQLSHPPVVLWLPMVANGACLGCSWIERESGSIDEAAESARRHSIGSGGLPSAVSRLRVPISERNGPKDDPLDRQTVLPRPR